MNNKCVGAQYIPEFVNETEAMDQSGNPFNCFLKYNSSGMEKNLSGLERISICLAGECEGVDGG